jgi:hypothetical protein
MDVCSGRLGKVYFRQFCDHVRGSKETFKVGKFDIVSFNPESQTMTAEIDVWGVFPLSNVSAHQTCIVQGSKVIFRPSLLNNYHYNYRHYAVFFANRVVDFQLGEVSCDGQIFFSNFNFTRVIDKSKQYLINFLSNEYQEHHTRLQLLVPGAAGAFNLYARDLKIYDDYLVASAEMSRSFPDFLGKFRGQAGGVCCGPPVLSVDKDQLRYYAPAAADGQKESPRSKDLQQRLEWIYQ